MANVLWLTSAFRTSRANASSRIPGAYAGRARFLPHEVSKLPDVLGCAAGTIVELAYAGIAGAGEPFTGQALYLEWRTDALLHGFLIPEQDLEFLPAERTASADIIPHRPWRSTTSAQRTHTS